MTDRDIIKKEAERRLSLITDTNITSYAQGYIDAYKGILQFIEDMQDNNFCLWHKCSEVPMPNYHILVITRDDKAIVLNVYGGDDYCIHDGIWIHLSQQKQWAYIDDLLSIVDRRQVLGTIWHDSDKEQPKYGSNVIILSDQGGDVLHNIIEVRKGRRWAYLNDILAL